MTPTNNRPEWACAQWTTYEHDWHNCPACLAAYEVMIELAQDDSELEVVEHEVGSSD